MVGLQLPELHPSPSEVLTPEHYAKDELSQGEKEVYFYVAALFPFFTNSPPVVRREKKYLTPQKPDQGREISLR